MELDWEDRVGEGRPEPAQGVNGALGRGGQGEAPSPFNREPLSESISFGLITSVIRQTLRNYVKT